MAYEFRNHIDFKFGTLTAAVAVSDTTLSSAEFAEFATGYSTGNYFPMVLLNAATKEHEKVWMVGHGAGSTSATFVRGRENTSAKAWPAGTQWVCGPTLYDTLKTASSSAQPGDPHIGMRSLFLDWYASVERTFVQGWLGNVRANPADMGRAIDGTTSHPVGRVPNMKFWTVSGTTNASGGLAAPIPNGGYPTRLISVNLTPYGTNTSYIATVNSTSTKDTIQIYATYSTSGAVVNTVAISVGIQTIGY